MVRENPKNEREGGRGYSERNIQRELKKKKKETGERPIIGG